MTDILAVCAALILASVLMGVWRSAKGPTRADRMQAAQLLGTAGTALLVILWVASGQEALLDLAVVLALLSAVTIVIFTKRVWPSSKEPPSS